MEVSSSSDHKREGDARMLLYKDFFEEVFNERSLIIEIAPSVGRILKLNNQASKIHCVFPYEIMRDVNIDWCSLDLKTTTNSNITYCTCPFPFHYESCDLSKVSYYKTFSIIRFISVDHTYYVRPQTWIFLHEIKRRYEGKINVGGKIKDRSITINVIFQLVPSDGLKEKKVSVEQVVDDSHVYCLAAGDTVNWKSPKNNITTIMSSGYKHGNLYYSWAKNRFKNSMLLMTLGVNTNDTAPSTSGHHQQFEALYSVTLPYTTNLDDVSMDKYRTYYIPESLVNSIMGRLGSIINSDPNTLAARTKTINLPGNPLAILHLSMKIMILLSNTFQTSLDQFLLREKEFKIPDSVAAAARGYGEKILMAFIGMQPNQPIFMKLTGLLPDPADVADYLGKMVRVGFIIFSILDPTNVSKLLAVGAIVPSIIVSLINNVKQWMELPDRPYFEVTNLTDLSKFISKGVSDKLITNDRIVYYNATNDQELKRNVKSYIAPDIMVLDRDTNVFCSCRHENKQFEGVSGVVTCDAHEIPSSIIPTYRSRIMNSTNEVFHENPVLVICKITEPVSFDKVHIISNGHKNYVVKKFEDGPKLVAFLPSNQREDIVFAEAVCGFSSLMTGLESWRTWNYVAKTYGAGCLCHDYDQNCVSDFPNKDCVYCRIGFHQQIKAPNNIYDNYKTVDRVGGIKVPYLNSRIQYKEMGDKDRFYELKIAIPISYSRDLPRLKYWKYGLFSGDFGNSIKTVLSDRTGDLVLDVVQSWSKKSVMSNGPGRPAINKVKQWNEDLSTKNNFKIIDRLNFDESFPEINNGNWLEKTFDSVYDWFSYGDNKPQEKNSKIQVEIKDKEPDVVEIVNQPNDVKEPISQVSSLTDKETGLKPANMENKINDNLELKPAQLPETKKNEEKQPFVEQPIVRINPQADYDIQPAKPVVEKPQTEQVMPKPKPLPISLKQIKPIEIKHEENSLVNAEDKSKLPVVRSNQFFGIGDGKKIFEDEDTEGPNNSRELVEIARKTAEEDRFKAIERVLKENGDKIRESVKTNMSEPRYTLSYSYLMTTYNKENFNKVDIIRFLNLNQNWQYKRDNQIATDDKGIFYDDVGFYAYECVIQQNYQVTQLGLYYNDKEFFCKNDAVILKALHELDIPFECDRENSIFFRIKIPFVYNKRELPQSIHPLPTAADVTIFKRNIDKMISLGYGLREIRTNFNTEKGFLDVVNFILIPSGDNNWIANAPISGSGSNLVTHWKNTGSFHILTFDTLAQSLSADNVYDNYCNNPKVVREEVRQPNSGHFKKEGKGYLWTDDIIQEGWKFSLSCECERVKVLLLPSKTPEKSVISISGDYPMSTLPSCLVGCTVYHEVVGSKEVIKTQLSCDDNIEEINAQTYDSPAINEIERIENFKAVMGFEPKDFKFPNGFSSDSIDNPRKNWKLIKYLAEKLETRAIQGNEFFNYLRLYDFCHRNVFSYGSSITMGTILQDGPGGSGKSTDSKKENKNLCSFTKEAGAVNEARTYQLYLKDVARGSVKTQIVVDEGLLAPLEYLFSLLLYKRESTVKLLSDFEQGIGGGNYEGKYSWFSPNDQFDKRRKDDINVFRFGDNLAQLLRQAYYSYDFNGVGRNIQIVTYDQDEKLKSLIEMYKPTVIICLSKEEVETYKNTYPGWSSLFVTWRAAQGCTYDTVLYWSKFDKKISRSDLKRADVVALSRPSNTLIIPNGLLQFKQVLPDQACATQLFTLEQAHDGVPADYRVVDRVKRPVEQKFEALAAVIVRYLYDNIAKKRYDVLELSPGNQSYLANEIRKFLTDSNIFEKRDFILEKGCGYTGEVHEVIENKKIRKILKKRPYDIENIWDLIIMDINTIHFPLPGKKQRTDEHPLHANGLSGLPLKAEPEDLISMMRQYPNKAFLTKFNRPPKKIPKQGLWLVMEMTDNYYQGEEYYFLGNGSCWLEDNVTNIDWKSFPLINPHMKILDEVPRDSTPVSNECFGVTNNSGQTVARHYVAFGKLKFMYLNDFKERITFSTHHHQQDCTFSNLDWDTSTSRSLLSASFNILDRQRGVLSVNGALVPPGTKFIKMDCVPHDWRSMRVLFLNGLHPRHEGPCAAPKDYQGIDEKIDEKKVIYRETFATPTCLDKSQQKMFDKLLKEDDITATPYAFSTLPFEIPNKYLRNWKMNAHNALVSLERRQFAYKHFANPMTVAYWAKIAREEFELMQKQGLVPDFNQGLTPTGRALWMRKFKPFRQKAYEKVKDDTHDNQHFHETEVMCKADEIGVYNIPRAISSFETRAAYRSGPACDALLEFWKDWQRLNDHGNNEGPVFTSGMAGSKLAKDLCENDATFGVDFSKFDSSLSYELLREAIKIIEKAYDHPSWKAMISSFGIWIYTVRLKGHRRTKVRYYGRGSMLSGHPLTTILNTIINIMVMALAKRFMRKSGFNHIFRSFHVGDDTACANVRGLKKCYEKASKCLGLTAEIVINDIPEYNSAFAVWSRSKEYFMVPSNIKRAIKRYYVTMYDKRIGGITKFESYSAALQASLDLNCFNGVPILEDVAKDITQKYGVVDFSDERVAEWLRLDNHSYDKLNNFHSEPLDPSFKGILLELWGVGTDINFADFAIEDIESKVVSDKNSTLCFSYGCIGVNNNLDTDVTFRRE